MMKDLFQVTLTTAAKVEVANLPKGLTDKLTTIVEKAIPLAERVFEAWVKEEEK